MEKRFYIGISSFKKLVSGEYCFIDKTLLIKEIVENPNKVIFIPRPRRFGKTINVSMLKYFFENVSVFDTEEKCNQYLFTPLKIWQEGEKYTELQGKFPIIYFNLKNVKRLNWKSTYQKFAKLIRDEYKRHSYLLESDKLSADDKTFYNKIVDLESTQQEVEISLRKLSNFLYIFHNRRAILLIDEYDKPIFSNYPSAFYETIIKFQRDILANGIVDNPAIEKAVIVGVLGLTRVAHPLNAHLCTALNPVAGDKFGFTQEEVKEVLEKQNLKHHFKTVCDWYGGYTFGNHKIINPWSVIHFFNNHEEEPKLYWHNTNLKVSIKELVIKSSPNFKAELQKLFKGEKITRHLDSSVVLPEIEADDDAFWSFLLHNGYIKAENETEKNGKSFYEIQFVNIETRDLFEQVIHKWLHESIGSHRLDDLFKSLLNRDVKTFEVIMLEFIQSISSYYLPHNRTINVYYAFILGLIVSLKDYQIDSKLFIEEVRSELLISRKDSEIPVMILSLQIISDAENNEDCIETKADKVIQKIMEGSFYNQIESNNVVDIYLMGGVANENRILMRNNIQ